MKTQLELLDGQEMSPATDVQGPSSEGLLHPDLNQYERILISCSGGKDSVACVLHLLELGVPVERMELHHYRVDGDEGSDLMDWPCTDSYVKALADHLRIRLLFSWRVGGLERELLRENCGTAPITFTRGDGSLVTMGGERSKPNTRRKFPQVTADLRLRWCSGLLKGDVASRLLVNDPRFTLGKTLVVTGERAEESANRARYASFEPDRADNRSGRVPRWIDHWRPVLHWRESQVWESLRRHRICAHPAYWVGLGRASCQACVFQSPNGWATMRAISPARFERIAAYEEEFGVTIHRTLSVREQADRGKVLTADPEWIRIATTKEFTRSIVMDPWMLPPGAYGENSGPS